MKIGEINILVRFIFIVFVTDLFSSCYEDDTLAPEYNNSSSSFIEFISDPMQRYKVTTRAGNIKDDEEKMIHNLHVFFFDDEENFLTGGYLTGYPNAPEQGGYYSLTEGVTSLKIDNEPDKFTNYDKASNVTIFAVANVDPLMFPIDETTDRPSNVSTLTDLKKMVFYIGKEKLSLGIPENGIPMVGETKMNLTDNVNKSHIVELTSLMARVDVNIRLESDITDRNYPSLTLMDWTAKNLPVKGAFTAPLFDAQTGDELPGEEGTLWADWTKSINTPLQKTIYNKNGEISFSFYMFENIQKAEWKVDKGEEWYDETQLNENGLYPKEILENPDKIYQKQRYKPYLANKNATAVELHAFYSTYNETGSGAATYEVRYTLYLGANYTDNFEVKRNHKYENNITIKGLTQVGTNPDHITFDARVNVKDQANEYYIAILRERNHDAHFCVTPMDVYLFKDVEGSNLNPTMEVILGEVPEGSEIPSSIPEWIRMEKICAADMKGGTVEQSGFRDYKNGGTHLSSDREAWCAGNGKRAFFTKDLLTNPDKLAEKGKRVTIDHTRDRVYFYIDENLKLVDREAIVTLIYKENGTEKKRRTITIGQTHLLPIITQNGKTIYMEQYEEYLDHYDPLDEHRTEQIYDGLPWAKENTGLDNYNIEQLYSDHITILGVTYPSLQYENVGQIYFDGYPYTSFIIYRAEQMIMHLNAQPRSAFEYCYNRNKRNDNGTLNLSYIPRKTAGLVGDDVYEEDINESKWFLPGIRQMEDALKAYYTTYREFQEEFYWSSSAGERANGSSGQNPQRARATKVDLTHPSGYAQSGGGDGEGWQKYAYEYGNGGYTLRTQPLRIRAFRVDLEKVE